LQIQNFLNCVQQHMGRRGTLQGSFTLWFLLHFVWFLVYALYSTFQLQMQEIVKGQNNVKFCKLYSENFKFLGQKIFPTNYTYSLLLHYLCMHSEWFYIKSARSSWCAVKFSVTKVSICWLFLAKVCVFLQLFQCQHLLANFVQATFHARRIENVIKYVKPVYVCK